MTNHTENSFVQFVAEDFVNNVYMDGEDCPCARACQRHFKTTDVTVGVNSVRIERIRYKLGPVVLNGLLIDHYGFDMRSYFAIKQAFAQDPQTKAHVKAYIPVHRPEFKRPTP